MRHSLFVLTIALQAPLTALLPPAWQDVAELKVLLSDPNLKDYLESGESIERIEKQEGGWAIVTNKATFYADIVPEKQTMPGPLKFSVQFKK